MSIENVDIDSPGSNKRDYVTQWLSQDAENGSCTVCYEHFEVEEEDPQVSEIEVKGLNDSYDDYSDDEAIEEVLPLNTKRTYGSFDYTVTKREVNRELDAFINAMIKSVVANAVQGGCSPKPLKFGATSKLMNNDEISGQVFTALFPRNLNYVFKLRVFTFETGKIFYMHFF
jgi:hypothetical protein